MGLGDRGPRGRPPGADVRFRVALGGASAARSPGIRIHNAFPPDPENREKSRFFTFSHSFITIIHHQALIRPVMLLDDNSHGARTEQLARGLRVTYGDQPCRVAGGQGRETPQARFPPLHQQPRRLSRSRCAQESVGHRGGVLSRGAGGGSYRLRSGSGRRWHSLPGQRAGTTGRTSRCRAASAPGARTHSVGHALRRRTPPQLPRQSVPREPASIARPVACRAPSGAPRSRSASTAWSAPPGRRRPIASGTTPGRSRPNSTWRPRPPGSTR